VSNQVRWIIEPIITAGIATMIPILWRGRGVVIPIAVMALFGALYGRFAGPGLVSQGGHSFEQSVPLFMTAYTVASSGCTALIYWFQRRTIRPLFAFAVGAGFFMVLVDVVHILWLVVM